MRCGVASYALTFSAWQMFLNIVDYQRPPPEPDLVVTDLTVPPRVRGDQTTRIVATLANQGDAAAGASTTEFVLDGATVLGNVTTAAIAEGGSSQVSLNWRPRKLQGLHTIQATADAGNVVVEELETNNAGVLTVDIQGNKVTNGSIEQANTEGTGPEGWTASNTAAGQTSWSEDGTDGSRGAEVSGTGGSVLLAGAPTWTSAPIDVVPGEVLEVVASVRTDGASSAPSVALAYLGAAGQVLDKAKVLTAPLSTGGFVTLEKSVTVPAGVAEVRVVLSGFAPTDTHTSGTIVFDDVGIYAT
jgi:hypothetical protein